MCFVKIDTSGGLKGPNGEELFLDVNNVGKDSPIELLRKTPKTREQIVAIIEEKMLKLPEKSGKKPKDNGDKI